jgi:hypothetical protein
MNLLILDAWVLFIAFLILEVGALFSGHPFLKYIVFATLMPFFMSIMLGTLWLGKLNVDVSVWCFTISLSVSLLFPRPY